MPWFRKKKGKIEPVRDSERVVRTENVFVRCEECGEHLYKKELEEALQVCVHCSHHFRLGAYERLELLFDDAHCEELDAEVVSTDPLEFVDSKPYVKRIAQAQSATGLPEAVITARGKVGGHRAFGGACLGDRSGVSNWQDGFVPFTQGRIGFVRQFTAPLASELAGGR